MPNSDLVDYIKEELAEGAQKDELVKDLLAVGWNKTDIDEALMPASARIGDRHNAQKPPSLVSGPGTSATTVVRDGTERFSSFIFGNNTYFLFIGAISLLIFSGAALGYYFYHPKTDILIEEMTNAMRRVTAVNTKHEISISRKEAQDEPFDFTGKGSVYVDARDTSAIKMHGEGDFVLVRRNSDAPVASLTLNVDAVNGERISYVRINDIALTANAPFDDKEKTMMAGAAIQGAGETISGQWIAVNAQDAHSIMDGLAALYPTPSFALRDTETDHKEKGGENVLVKLSDLAQLWNKMRFIDFKTVSSEKESGEETYRIKGSLDKSATKTFFTEAEKIITGNVFFGLISLVTSGRQTPWQLLENGEELSRALDGVVSSDLELWIGKRDHLLRRARIRADIRRQDPAKSSGARENVLTLSLESEFSQYNEPLELDDPAQPMEFLEALGLLWEGMMRRLSADSAMTQETPEGYAPHALDDSAAETDLSGDDTADQHTRDLQRLSDILTIRTALEKYAQAYSSYPTSLNELYLVAPPSDPLDGAPYAYSYYPATNPTKYHIGASMETYDAALESDADLDAPSSPNGFNGADNQKCKEEDSGQFCFDVIGDIDHKERSERDAKRITDIRQLQLALELFYDSNDNTYPEHLDKLSPAYIADTLNDPQSQAPYFYAWKQNEKGKNVFYHLGADLETTDHPALNSDADCDSLAPEGCREYAGQFLGTPFNGDENDGNSACNDTESNTYCYDINGF